MMNLNIQVLTWYTTLLEINNKLNKSNRWLYNY